MAAKYSSHTKPHNSRGKLSLVCLAPRFCLRSSIGHLCFCGAEMPTQRRAPSMSAVGLLGQDGFGPESAKTPADVLLVHFLPKTIPNRGPAWRRATAPRLRHCATGGAKGAMTYPYSPHSNAGFLRLIMRTHFSAAPCGVAIPLRTRMFGCGQHRLSQAGPCLPARPPPQRTSASVDPRRHTSGLGVESLPAACAAVSPMCRHLLEMTTVLEGISHAT